MAIQAWFKARPFSSTQTNQQTVARKQQIENRLLVIFLLVTWGITGLLSPRFLSPSNMSDILVQAAPLGFVVLGQMLVIIVRGLDLSIASVMASSAVVVATFNGPLPMAIACALLLGLVVGGINAYLISVRKVTPFLTTLATMIVLQGVRFAYTKGAPGANLSDTIRWLATGDILGVPVSIVVLLVIAGLIHWFITRTKTGIGIMLFGDNPKTSFMVGGRVRWLESLPYLLSGLLAAVAGLFLVGYVGIVDNWTGQGYELDSIAAAVIGGASLRGGKGSVFGAMVATLILISLFNIVVILGMSTEFQLIIKGSLIILAAVLYASMQRRQ